jgi:hypothetical protein
MFKFEFRWETLELGDLIKLSEEVLRYNSHCSFWQDSWVRQPCANGNNNTLADLRNCTYLDSPVSQKTCTILVPTEGCTLDSGCLTCSISGHQFSTIEVQRYDKVIRKACGWSASQKNQRELSGNLGW